MFSPTFVNATPIACAATASIPTALFVLIASTMESTALFASNTIPFSSAATTLYPIPIPIAPKSYELPVPVPVPLLPNNAVSYNGLFNWNSLLLQQLNPSFCCEVNCNWKLRNTSGGRPPHQKDCPVALQRKELTTVVVIYLMRIFISIHICICICICICIFPTHQ